jgi:hypothetical protein
VTYKRSATDRALTFTAPSPECFACYDTGIVTNGDGLLSEHLPDYDRSFDGKLRGGTDCAIVCHCLASYPQQDADGKLSRGGFRQDSGSIRIVTTEQGDRRVGAEIPREITADLHRRRRELWASTAKAMNAARLDRRSNTASEPPWFIATIREHLASPAPSRDHRLQPIGAILGTFATAKPAASSTELPHPVAVAIERLCSLDPLKPQAAAIRKAITARYRQDPAFPNGLANQLLTAADSIAEDHPNPIGLLEAILGAQLPPIPKPTAEASSSPGKAPEPPPPVSPTPDPSDWPF